MERAARRRLSNVAREFSTGGGQAAQRTGLWEVEATIPKLRSGVIVAPIWLYDKDSADELDIEPVGTRATATIHVGGTQKQVTIAGGRASRLSVTGS